MKIITVTTIREIFQEIEYQIEVEDDFPSSESEAGLTDDQLNEIWSKVQVASEQVINNSIQDEYVSDISNAN